MRDLHMGGGTDRTLVKVTKVFVTIPRFQCKLVGECQCHYEMENFYILGREKPVEEPLRHSSGDDRQVVQWRISCCGRIGLAPCKTEAQGRDSEVAELWSKASWRQLEISSLWSSN